MSLRQRIGFTLGALIVYRLGTYIPLPGIDPSAWEQIFRSQAGGFLGMFNMFAGGGIHRMAIFALNIMPYISASILVQLVALVFLRRWLNENGHRGRQKVQNWTRGLALLMTVSQASGVAVALENATGIVAVPGPWFEVSTILTLTAGTMFLIWLADQITTRGIGNGIALILTVGIIVELPSTIAGTLELGRQGALPAGLILLVIIMAAALVAFIVFMESARRNIAVRYVSQNFGGRFVEAVSRPISLKLNNAGIMPLVWPPFGWAMSLLTFALMLGPSSLPAFMSHGRPGFLLFYIALIVVFTLIYVALLFDTKRASATLDARGGVIPGVLPGAATEVYLDFVVSRITLVGGLYLALVCIVPELLIGYASVPFYLGGSAVLIVVCTMMDLGAQFQQRARFEGEGL